MLFHDLPPEAQAVLAKYAAPPRLIAHLIVVHDVAVRLVEYLAIAWPQLAYSQQDVLLGAATHDIGKLAYPDELTGPGTHHEEIGPQLLLESGYTASSARFAQTHARWQQDTSAQLEDVLVAFADTIWKGKRDTPLEQVLVSYIASQSQEEVWEVYIKLDEITDELAQGAHERILWQGKYAL
jgi:hypothetical protein